MFVEGSAIVAAGLDRAWLKIKNNPTPPSTVTATAARATRFQTLVEDFATTGGGTVVTAGPAGRGSLGGSTLAARRASGGPAFSVSSARGKDRSALIDVCSCAR